MKKVGIALGGGAAWSIACIGVLRVFEEENIPIDYLAGCSMGALIATAYASQFAGANTLDELEKIVETIKFKKHLSADRKHSFGLFSAHAIGDGFKKDIGKLNFQDLKIPTSVIATDFKTGEEVIFSDGPIAPAVTATSAFITDPEVVVKSGPIPPAITASAAIPIIFTPVEYKGRLLTDGGLSNPVGIDVVKQMGADIVIGIDIVNKSHRTRLDNINKKLPWHKRVIQLIPPLHYVTSRNVGPAVSQTIDLLFSNLNRLKIELCPPDFLLEPQVHHRNQLSFHYAKEYITEGERVAREIIPDLKKLLKD